MELYNITDETVCTVDEFKRTHSNTSFPEIIPEETFLDFGYKPILHSAKPDTSVLQQAVRDGVTVDVNTGRIFEKWKVVSKFSEYTDAQGIVHTVLEQETAELARIQEEETARNRALAKLNRQSQVDQIKVTTQSGKTFDGDEVSQTRMARAILALNGTNTLSTIWVLADNTPTQVTAAELTEALALAGAAQAAIWVIS